MLSVNTEKGFLPIENRNDYYIQMNYDGFHQLSFDVSNDDEILKYLINEAVIKNEDNRFLIKDVNRRTQNSTFTCEIDLDEWKQTVFFDTANDTRFQTKTLGEILNVIKPSGWKILNSSIRSIRRTPELKDVTPYDILISLESMYDVVYELRVLTKEIYVIDPNSIEYDGLYATDELNMKKVTWQGSSSEFCTKLFAYGKANEDGTVVNIASVNGGKEYIEDHTYTDKVITLVWRDERYTDPHNLLDDAKKKLDILCVPKMSYDVAIYDLAQVNKDYDFLQFGLYKQVKTFVNKDLSLMQRVVTYKKYYDKHDRNVATLSNEQQKFTSKVSNLLGSSSNTVVNGSILEQAQKESAQIINEFATKGYRYETENETYFLDKLPKESAKYVMRMNLGGIAFSQSGWSGPYTTAWTIDGKFNAGFITTGVLKAIKIESSEIYGGNININNVFKVDSSGNLIANSASIKGNFNGGSIKGDTTIDVGTDLYVGNNIYLNKSDPGRYKGIFLNDKNYIAFDGESQLSLHTTKNLYIWAQDQNNVKNYSVIGSSYNHCQMSVYKDYNQTSLTVYPGDILSSHPIRVSSDVRLKENIEYIDLTGVFKYLNVCSFNYKCNDNKTVGVIAQDFIGTEYEDIILKKDNKGFYSVDYNVINMAVAQVVSKLYEDVEKLKEKLK